MAYDDYTPVSPFSDEEEEQRKLGAGTLGGYVPVTPPTPPPAPTDSAPPPMPRSAAPEISAPTAPIPRIQEPQMPQWKDYAPPEPHGWSKFGHTVAALFPRTNYVFNELPEKRAEARYKAAMGEYEAPIAERAKEAQTHEAEARAAAQPADTAYKEAQTEALKHPAPKPKEEKWGEFTGFTDNDGTPLIREENSGQVVRANDRKPPQGFKPTAKAEKPDTPEQQFIDEETARGIPLAQAIADYAKTSQRPERPGAEDARGERSYQATVNRVDKLRKPVEDRLERLTRLEDTLNQGTPQADALVAPELLSVMAGGQASGLRMNEAEISRIVGGRTNWEALKAAAGKWQLDPSKGFAITPAQRQQIRDLFNAVKERATRKMHAIDEESQNLADSNDSHEHRQIYNRLQKTLDQIDSGAEQHAGGEKTISQAAIEKAAKDHGISVDEARKQAEAQGYQVH